MTEAVVTITRTLQCLECSECGTLFGLTSDFQQRRQEDHKSFYCPRGHSQYYPQQTEAERLRKRLHEETLAKERAEREATAAKEDAKRVKRRVMNGTCPCCKRTFKQLAAHMARKHPDYAHEA